MFDFSKMRFDYLVRVPVSCTHLQATRSVRSAASHKLAGKSGDGQHRQHGRAKDTAVCDQADTPVVRVAAIMLDA